MTARVLTGSKEEIARQVASLEDQVRQAIVFIEQPSDASGPPARTIEELFAEMEPHMVQVAGADDSREARYSRLPGE